MWCRLSSVICEELFSGDVFMKLAIVSLVLANIALGQYSDSVKSSAAPLRIELRTNGNRFRMTDSIAVTVFFRSPEREVTIWNALEWGNSAGLYLQVFDSSGKEVQNSFAPFFHPVPPDLRGRD